MSNDLNYRNCDNIGTVNDEVGDGNIAHLNCFGLLGSILVFWVHVVLSSLEMHLVSRKCFRFWEVYLESGKYFGLRVLVFWEVLFVQAIVFIQGSVFILESRLLFTVGILASWKCFRFWEEYWYKCFSDSGKCFAPRSNGGHFTLRGTTSVDDLIALCKLIPLCIKFK